MPARKNKIRHDEETRSKIQAAQIINRLMACVNGSVDLSPQQVSSAKTLLNKVLPDLQAVQLDGALDVETAITFNTTYEAPPDDV